MEAVWVKFNDTDSDCGIGVAIIQSVEREGNSTRISTENLFDMVLEDLSISEHMSIIDGIMAGKNIDLTLIYGIKLRWDMEED